MPGSTLAVPDKIYDNNNILRDCSLECYEQKRASEDKVKHTRKSNNSYVDGAIFTTIPKGCKVLDIEALGEFDIDLDLLNGSSTIVKVRAASSGILSLINKDFNSASEAFVNMKGNARLQQKCMNTTSRMIGIGSRFNRDKKSAYATNKEVKYTGRFQETSELIG